MNKQTPPTIQVILAASAYGGSSVGRYNGKAVFVPFTIPGEVVKVSIVEEKKNFALARLVEVVKPSPLRVEPPCPYHSVCGGCHYQHLPYQEQLNLKRTIFGEQLKKIAKITDLPPIEVVPSPSQLGYRNNVQFHLNSQGKPCFVPAETGVPLLAVEDCLLMGNASKELLPYLSFESESGIDRVILREAEGSSMLILESDELDVPALQIEADMSVVHITEQDTVVLAGEDYLVHQVAGQKFKVSAASFFQVNTQATAIMVEKVLDTINWDAEMVVMDLYCGVGLFSKFLAPRVGKIIALEVSSSSCADFVDNLDEFDNVELYEGLAEEIVPNIRSKVDVVVADPPRAGLDSRVTDALAKLMPTWLVYVSCDPTTFARDVARLAGHGYELASSTILDMFPHTYHIESINLFKRV